MKRTLVTIATVALLAAGCSGGGGDDEKDGIDLPLPDKAPSAAGPANGPAMAPKVLLASSDDLEEAAGSVDTAQVERRAGTFVSGNTVVGYSVDDISGYDLTSGDTLWRAKLDLEGGTVCFASQPDRAVKTFTVAYGEGGYCPSLATIRVSDGKVVKKSARLSDLNEFEGDSAGGSVNNLFTVKGKDYLLDMHGVVWRMKGGEPEPIKRLETDSYFTLFPTPAGDRLIGSRLSDRPDCRVDAYAIPSFELEWTKGNADLFPDSTDDDCVTVAAKGNPAWLMQEGSDEYAMTQVDPASGKVLGTTRGPKTPPSKPVGADEFNLASAANQFERAFGLPNGDMVFVQVGGMVRYSLEDEKVDWAVNLSQTELESTEDYPLTTVLPSGVTSDGYLISSVSNDTAVEVDAVDVKTGQLAARWPVSTEYRNGFQVEPGMTVYDRGVVMARNFEAWEFAFADYKDVKEPEGDRYDFGVFAFPEPDNTASTKVAAVGPTDTEATPLASVKSSSDAQGGVGTFNAGSRLITYAGGTVAGLDPKTGKKSWSRDLPDGQYVCSAPEPDRRVKAFTIALATEGKRGTCQTVARLRTSDGKVLDRVESLGGKTEASRIQTVDGRTYVVVTGGKVLRWKGGELVEHADVGRTFYTWERTPDPALVVATVPTAGNKDWVIEGFRLPGYEKAWSTTAKKLFGSVDPANTVTTWRGNGLWVSTYFGDLSKPDAKVDDSLVVLDADTGKPERKTGRVRRDYLADDLKKFSLTAGASSAYQTAGFDDGDVVVEQRKGIMRLGSDGTVRWATDTASIQNSMERTDAASYLSQQMDVIDRGRTVLVTMSNGTSVELMTLSAKDGTITGRWKVPEKFRNGLVSYPQAVPFGGNVALSRDTYGDASQLPKQSGPQLDIGVFRLDRPKKGE